MKKITFALLALFFSLSGFSQVQNYNVGDVVNDFTVTDTEGVEHNLYTETAAGKYVFLDFFFDTCPPCQQTTPIFNELHQKYGCNDGEIFCISINNGSDTDPEVIAFENNFGGPFEHAPAVSADGGAGPVDTDFGITAYPTYCLINPNNEIIVLDIWPINNVGTFEAAFPAGFDPAPMDCQPILAIENAIFLDQVSIYPNPVRASQNVQISLPEAIETSVTIFDVLGRRVHTGNYTTSYISIPLNEAAGTYIVKMDSERGSLNKTLLIK